MISSQSSFDDGGVRFPGGGDAIRRTESPPESAALQWPTLRSEEFGLIDLPHRNDQVLSPSVEALVGRHLVQRRLFTSGALQGEAEAAGLNPSWTGDLWKDADERCLIALAEPLAPLPTIFSQLGHFGSPEDLRRAFGVMRQCQHQLSDEGIAAKVGMASSRFFQITYHGETCNYQYYLPREDGGVTKHQLIPDRARKALAGSPHHLLRMPESSIQRLLKHLDNNRTPEGESLARDVVDSCKGAGIGTALISYWGLVSNYNHLFVSNRFECDFLTVDTDCLDGLLTFGVTDWSRFMDRAVTCGLVEQGRSFARRACLDEEGHFSHYEMLYAHDGALLANDSGSVFDAHELQHLSKESWKRRGELLLLPNKELRYWGFSFDSVVRFDDGVPFESLNRVAGIVGRGDMGQTPRELPLASYSRAGSVHHLGYAELEPVHAATDYY